MTHLALPLNLPDIKLLAKLLDKSIDADMEDYERLDEGVRTPADVQHQLNQIQLGIVQKEEILARLEKL